MDVSHDEVAVARQQDISEKGTLAIQVKQLVRSENVLEKNCGCYVMQVMMNCSFRDGGNDCAR